jgi:CrcB protein
VATRVGFPTVPLVSRRVPTPAMLGAVAAGGAAGALLRWGAGELVPEGDGFPWTTLAVNVVGSLVLALLPMVVEGPLVALALGPGLLGGFTTLSAYAEQARVLAADGRAGLAGTYVVVTLAGCVGAVHVAHRFTTRRQRLSFEAEEGNE